MSMFAAELAHAETLNKGDYVVLLHGIGSDARFMRSMEKYLQANGFETINVDYPSRKYPIESLVELVQAHVKVHVTDPTKKVHFVGHSMGNLVIRGLIARYRPINLGRVVMLGPPNQGSEVADKLKNYWIYRRFFGPAGQQLTTDQEIVRQLLHHEIDYDIGVIAGSFTFDPISSNFILSGPNDGKVTVERTKLVGMKEHVVVRVSHTFMPWNKDVMKKTLNFLSTGHFSP
ncbi:MAG: alpha/beta fold hydrolase [Pseudomonadota bacterium]